MTRIKKRNQQAVASSGWKFAACCGKIGDSWKSKDRFFTILYCWDLSCCGFWVLGAWLSVCPGAQACTSVTQKCSCWLVGGAHLQFYQMLQSPPVWFYPPTKSQMWSLASGTEINVLLKIAIVTWEQNLSEYHGRERVGRSELNLFSF